MRRPHSSRRKRPGKHRRFRRRALAAGTAAAISLGTQLGTQRAAAGGPDPHLLPVPADTDGDFLADTEEALLAYLKANPDQNRNDVLDGVELARLVAAAIDDLPTEPNAAPGQTYRVEHPAFGLETCESCPTQINMGFVEIVNPVKHLTVACPYICLHYMEHGSFSYAGTEHDGRVDVPALAAALELRLPSEPDDHQLPVAADHDADLLSSPEESAIGYQPFDPDQNRNGIPDGVELAQKCALTVAGLPEYHPPGDPPEETYKIAHLLDGLEACHVCGAMIHMGGWEIVNPALNLKYPDPNDPLERMFLPDLALHYMEHGSFDCYGQVHQGRVDIPRLLRVLGLRFPNDPNDHQLPLDYSVKPVGQLAPDANDYDGDLLADTEELAAGYNLYNPDQDANLIPDGIELAMQFAQAIDALPEYGPGPGIPEPTGPYKVNYLQRGLELCEVCGAEVNMGYWQVVNPRLGLSMDVHVIACHYMSHGSFSYSGLRIDPPHVPFHNGRIKLAVLGRILELPNRCGHLGSLYLPGDFNKDCRQDFIDLAWFAERWLQTTDPPADTQTPEN